MHKNLIDRWRDEAADYLREYGHLGLMHGFVRYQARIRMLCEIIKPQEKQRRNAPLQDDRRLWKYAGGPGGGSILK